MKQQFNMQKIFSLVLLVLATTSLSACGVTLGLDGGWVIEEEYEIIEYNPEPPQDRLVFEVRWDSFLDDTELKTVLLTPGGRHVTATGPEREGCYFLGTYDEPWGESVSTIECLAPYHGDYDLEIKNIGWFSTQARVRIVEEFDTGHELIRQVYSNQYQIYPSELLIATHHY